MATPEENARFWESIRPAREWAKTELGGLFHRYDAAIGRAWVTDCRPTASDATMKRDWEAANKARETFLDAVKSLEAKARRLEEENERMRELDPEGMTAARRKWIRERAAANLPMISEEALAAYWRGWNDSRVALAQRSKEQGERERGDQS